jgi:D-3-phosphoglycerate dehydrogenase
MCKARNGAKGAKDGSVAMTSGSTIPPLVDVAPRVYVGPDPDPKIMAAVLAAGAVLVALDQAEVAVWTSLDPTTFPTAAGVSDDLRWVQLLSAGVEKWIDSGVVDDTRTWTSARGASALTVAEHALAMLLAVRRRLVEAARANHWRSELEGHPLSGATALIVGCGAIGRALIPMLASLDVTSLAVTRSGRVVEGATGSYAAEHLPELWRRADIVVLAAPATARTRHLVDRNVLRALPGHAVVVNVARGSLIDTDALVQGLRSREIAGAALDVTDPEPLPTGHPLWDLDSVLVTPHNANPEIAWKANVGRRVAENLRRYRAGEALLGVIDLQRSY